ncbi:zinc finger SWIM domain-containing protein 5-like isoform X2 [Clavelina lepadiformis]|uniref:zinc finger SWIM domain-containing protein 5-like isoform X2 n=1 Tax=Clavelina lepadiformis TaxID=159417 RepID=UPI0040416FBA
MKRVNDFGNSSCYPGRSKYARFEEPFRQTRNKSGLKSNVPHTHTCKQGSLCCPATLADISAKMAASKIPFQLVEERYTRVPEPVVMKFITWSFPRSEADIQRYSALACDSDEYSFGKKTAVPSEQRGQGSDQEGHRPGLRPDHAGSANLDGQETTFKQGIALTNNGAVQQPMQIGFHLSGAVQDKTNDSSQQQFTEHSFQKKLTTRTYNVAVTFDRCKVTSSTCNCQDGEAIFFCRHIVALLIYRLRNPTKVKIRAPISDSLQQLNRDQLQKLTQYLLTRHVHVLPTAQEIADRFCDPGSHINVVHGAPDPTAGAGFQDDDRWNLDDSDVSKHVRGLLAQCSSKSSAQQLYSMMRKVREMMKVRDNNGARLLTLITKELLQHSSHMRSQQSNNVCSQLWDEIGLLWICVILYPSDQQEKESFLKQLKTWSSDSQCPSEDDSADFSLFRSSSPDRTVLSRAIEAGSLTWLDQHLNVILCGKNTKSSRITGEEISHHSGGSANFNSKGQPLWHEHIPTACARVEALRSYGYTIEAVRLAVAIARTIRESTVNKYKTYQQCQQQKALPVERNNGCGLVGHPLNPIRILFETLTSSYDASDEEVLKQEEGCSQESLRREAFEVCLLAVGEQRCMPRTTRAQEKMLAREKQLIDYIKQLTPEEDLIPILRNVTNLLLEGGSRSGFGKHVHRESMPMHSFATYLFNALHSHDRKLAFKVGVQAMRIPILDTTNDQSQCSDNRNRATRSPVHRLEHRSERNRENAEGIFESSPPQLNLNYSATWSVMGDIETRQYDLASALLESAKGDVMLLRMVVESIQRNVRNTSHVFQLSHDAFKCATFQTGATAPDPTMLHVAMQLSMQVLRMTMQGGTWRRTEMVGWLVTCATEIGLSALMSVIKSWYTLFTPVEACTMVASCVISANTAMRLNLDPRQREELYQNVCQMAVQCAVKDPQSCALCSLTLSETFTAAFDNVYHVIIDASNKRRIDSGQLYTTARYLDQRGFHARAFAVAYAATRRLRVPFNHDAHPAANDLLWTTQLAQSLGMQELEDLINIIVNKVRCASVLSDVLRTCTSSISGRLPNCAGSYGNRGLRADRPPLRPLLEAAISAYVSTIHSKLSHISPRHYTEFIDFLNKARDTFLMAPDGYTEFSRLLANLKTIYKGKKKLLNLVTLRFG